MNLPLLCWLDPQRLRTPGTASIVDQAHAKAPHEPLAPDSRGGHQELVTESRVSFPSVLLSAPAVGIPPGTPAHGWRQTTCRLERGSFVGGTLVGRLSCRFPGPGPAVGTGSHRVPS